MQAFRGRTVDNLIAAMEARHPYLTTQKCFYVEISRARYRADLLTHDQPSSATSFRSPLRDGAEGHR